MIDFGLYLTYFLVGLTTLLLIGSLILQIVQNIKGATNIIIGLVGLLVVLGIAYGFAGDQMIFGSDGDPLKYGTSPETMVPVTTGLLKWTGAAIISIYIMVTLAVVSVIYSEVSGFFK